MLQTARSVANCGAVGVVLVVYVSYANDENVNPSVEMVRQRITLFNCEKNKTVVLTYRITFL